MVDGRYRGEIDLSRLDTGILPEKIGYVTTVQFLDYNKEIISFLESKGKKVFIGKYKESIINIINKENKRTEFY